MYIYKARVKESNCIGNNYTLELGDYSSPIATSISSSPSSDGNSMSTVTYEAGQEVLCIDVDGIPVILGAVPQEFRRGDAGGKEEVSGMEINTRSTPESDFILSSKFARIGEHSNFLGVPESLPGDNIFKAAGGNSIKILSGGINVLDAGGAKITTNGVTNEVSIDCHKFSLNTGFGTLKIAPGSSGGFSLDFKGNTVPGNTNPNNTQEGNPVSNVSFRLGNDLEVMAASGYGVKVNPSGKVTIVGKSLYLDKGGVEVPIAGGVEAENGRHETISPEIIQNASRSITQQSAGDINISSSGDLVSTAGRTLSCTINGVSPVQNPMVLANPAGVYSKEESILSGSSKQTVGSVISGGGKYRVDCHGDIHLSSNTHATGGGSVLIDPATAPGAVSSGVWNSVNTAKLSLHTSLLPSTPAVPMDGLPHAWAALPPIPFGVNPALTGYCKYAQFQAMMLPFLTALGPALAALATNPALALVVTTPPLLATASAAALAALPLMPLTETKTSYINELPI